MKNCEETRTWSDAYLDGELDPIHSREIERHLQSCPGCAQVFDEECALAAALRAPGLRHRAPAGLHAQILATLRAETGGEEKEAASGNVVAFPAAQTPWWGWRSLAAMAAALVVLLSISLVLLQRGRGLDLLAQEVVSSHVRSLMATHLADVVSTDKHTVKPWFDGKLDFAPAVPDFASAGFPLIGGRLDYLDQRPVAALVYGRDKHVINVFVWPASSQDTGTAATEAKSVTRQGYHLLHWQRAGMNYWAVSDLNEAELQKFGELTRQGAEH